MSDFRMDEGHEIEPYSEAGKKHDPFAQIEAYEAERKAKELAEKSPGPPVLERVFGPAWVNLYNPVHYPPGSGKGGQFAPKGTSGGANVPDIVDKGETPMLRQLLKENGGFTYQPFLNESPKDGFMVSPYKDCEFVLPSDKVTGRALAKYMRSHRDKLTKPDHYMGGWVDDGKAYIDISVRRSSKAEALSLAKQHDQLAIFDLGNMETVYVQ